MKKNRLTSRTSLKIMVFWSTQILMLYSNPNLKAQEIKKLGLDEALQLASRHSYQLKADSFDIGVRKYKYIQTQNSLIPSIGLNLSYLRLSNNISPYTISLPSGSIILNPQILNQSYNSLQIKELLFSGGKVSNAIKASRKELEATIQEKSKDSLENLTKIMSLWYNLYILKTSVKIIENNKANLNAKKRDVVNFQNQGIGLFSDVLKIDLAVNNLESNIADLNHSIEAVNYTLCILTGLPVTMRLELPDSLSLSEPQLPKLENYLQEAVGNRPELKQIRATKEASVFGYKIAKAGYFPSLSVLASYNYDQPNIRVFPAQNYFSGSWYLGLNLNWTLSDLFLNAPKVNEAKKILNKVSSIERQVREGIQIEVYTQYTDYLATLEKIRISQKALEESKENFRVETNRLNATTTTPTDYLTAETQFLQAQLNLNSAIASSKLSYQKLIKTTGK